MGRNFRDEGFLYLPEELPEEDYAYEDGIEYKRIPGFPDYFVSTEGIVISFRRRYPRVLHMHETNHGHLYVDLTNSVRKKREFVHRLVAEAFIPNPFNYPLVRHLNDHPWDNVVDNLAWGTQSDNINDAIENGTYYMEPVYCFEDDMHFRSLHDAARYYNTSPTNIFHNCNKITHSCLGKHFCYKDDIDSIDHSSLKIYTGYKPIIAISPDGTEYWFDSRKSASEKLNIPNCGISSVVNGKLKHTHGWRFREAK